ncbi:hypothetical protein V3N95_11860 (plasmid) [Micrococcaceae bacterium Sec6.3]
MSFPHHLLPVATALAAADHPLNRTDLRKNRALPWIGGQVILDSLVSDQWLQIERNHSVPR